MIDDFRGNGTINDRQRVFLKAFVKGNGIKQKINILLNFDVSNYSFNIDGYTNRNIDTLAF